MENYSIEILKNNNGSPQLVAKVLNPYPLNASGDILQFTKELSDFGQAKFRVSAYDDIFDQYGDIFVPHEYHINIRRNGTIVWQGAIVDDPKRTKDYWQIQCAEYEFYLLKVMVQRTSNDPATGTADGIFRIFNSGTMSAAVTAIINETIATLNQSTNKNSTLAGLSLGTIENPNFPPNMTDATGKALTGAWVFSNTLQLQFDFQSILYVLKSFGNLAYADFQVNSDLSFDFKKFIGNDRHYDVNFVFNKSGDFAQSNIIDYNLPRFGQRMVNKLWGIATDTTGKVLNSPQSDESSITTSGLMEGVAAYADVNDSGILRARTAAELPLVSSPDPNSVNIVLDETAAYPLGVWDIGDIVSLNIKNKGINFSDSRRVVGVSVNVHNTGREITTVQTNKVLPWQYGSINS